MQFLVNSALLSTNTVNTGRNSCDIRIQIIHVCIEAGSAVHIHVIIHTYTQFTLIFIFIPIHIYSQYLDEQQLMNHLGMSQFLHSSYCKQESIKPNPSTIQCVEFNQSDSLNPCHFGSLNRCNFPVGVKKHTVNFSFLFPECVCV